MRCEEHLHMFVYLKCCSHIHIQPYAYYSFEQGEIQHITIIVYHVINHLISAKYY